MAAHLRACCHVGFFYSHSASDEGIVARDQLSPSSGELKDLMHDQPALPMAQQIAEAATTFQRVRTGRTPKSVTVVLSQETLVLTLHEALSPAEIALSQTAEGAKNVQEFHRKLFDNSAGALREEIQRITGVGVREAALQVEPATGAIIQVFTSGTMVQVFQLEGNIPLKAWNGA